MSTSSPPPGPDPVALRRAASSLRHPLARVLLALTFTTGLVDATTYLGLGHVFAANMTGNVVLLGFGIAGAGGLPVVAPVVSLVAFLAGAGLGGRLDARLSDRPRLRLGAALALEAAFLGAAVVVVAAASVRAGTFSGDVVIALLAFAMGVRNAVVKAIGVPDMTTTVLTMTLTGLAAQSRLFGGDDVGNLRRGAAAVTMLAGGVAGALLEKVSLTVVIAAAAAFTASTLVVYARVDAEAR